MGGTTTAPARVLAPQTRKDLRFWVLADLAAHGLLEWRASYRWSQPVVHYQVVRRRAEYWRYGSDHHSSDRQGPTAAVTAAALAARVQVLGRRLGLDIPLGTTGPGLLLTPDSDPSAASTSSSGAGIRVHPDSRLGSNCTLHHGVTVDAADGRAAALGDHCLLGHGVTVLGAHLGHRVEASAGAVVDRDFGDDVRLAGNPAVPLQLDKAVSQRRRDGRRTTLTPDQVELARQMHAAGELDPAAIADAFWVSPVTLQAYLTDEPTRAS